MAKQSARSNAKETHSENRRPMSKERNEMPKDERQSRSSGAESRDETDSRSGDEEEEEDRSVTRFNREQTEAPERETRRGIGMGRGRS